MNDQNPAHLTAAGFVETSPNVFERENVVCRYSPHGLDSAFAVFATDHDINPSFRTGHIGEALLMANACASMAELADAIAGAVCDSTAFYLTGERHALDFREGRGIAPQAEVEFQRMCARAAVFLIAEAARADLLPKDPPTADDADDTPPAEVARRLLAGADAEVDSTTRAAMIRAAALLTA